MTRDNELCLIYCSTVLKHLNQLHCFEQHSSPFQHHENGLRHSTHLPENGPDNLHTVLLQHGANIVFVQTPFNGIQSPTKIYIQG